jgi:glycosyltransferase involved in cell wall biosynthesis
LAARNHDSAVIAPGPWRLADRLKAGGVEVAEIRSRACWLVQWGPQPAAIQILRYLRYRLPDPGYRRMMVWLDRYWPDVVYVNCLPQLKGAAAARALGLPVVWHVREILPPGPRRRWFARRLRRDATRIVAVSEAVAGWISDEGLAEKVSVIHNGVGIPADGFDGLAMRDGMGLPATGVVVGFLGGMAVHKGAGDLVRAGERAIAAAPELHFVIPTYGPAAEIDALRTRVTASAAAGHFHLIPPLEDVFRLLAAVDIVAFTSIWPDSLPRVVMEAMAAGRPVAAYRTGGVPEMVADGETGFMVETGEVEALAERMVRLAGDPELRRRMGAAAAARARAEFSVASHVDAMERILKEAAGG